MNNEGNKRQLKEEEKKGASREAKVRKKVSFGKAYIRVYLNYYDYGSSSDEMESNMATKGGDYSVEEGLALEDEDSVDKHLPGIRPRTDSIKVIQEYLASSSNQNKVPAKRLNFEQELEKRPQPDFVHKEIKSILKKHEQPRTAREQRREREARKNERERQRRSWSIETPSISTKKCSSNSNDTEKHQIASKPELRKTLAGPDYSKQEKVGRQDDQKETSATNDQSKETKKSEIGESTKEMNPDEKAVVDDGSGGTAPEKVKDDEKWSGNKSLGGALGDFQMSGGVYSGVEANWKETKDSLANVGVDVEEDKLQNPSEFIAVMSLFLDLKTAGRLKMDVEKTNISADEKPDSLPDFLRNLPMNIAEGSDKEDQTGTQRNGSRSGLRVRSNSESLLEQVGQLGLKGDITHQKRYYSVEDVRFSKSGELKSGNTSKWPKVIKRFWKNIKKKKAHGNKVENKSVNENMDEKESTVSEVKEAGLLSIAAKLQVSSSQTLDNMVDKNSKTEVQEPCEQINNKFDKKDDGVGSILTSNREDEKKDMERTLISIVKTVRKCDEIQIENVSQVTEAIQIEEASEVEEMSEEASEVEEAGQEQEVVHIGKAIRTVEAIQVEEAVLVAEASQVEKARQVKRMKHASEVEEGSEVEETNRNLEATQVEGANRNPEASQVEEANQIKETSQLQEVIRTKGTNQIEEASKVEKASQVEECIQPGKAIGGSTEANKFYKDAATVEKACQADISIDEKVEKKKRIEGDKVIQKKRRRKRTHSSGYQERHFIQTKFVATKDQEDPHLQLRLFFRTLSRMPGHELCVLFPMQYRYYY